MPIPSVSPQDVMRFRCVAHLRRVPKALRRVGADGHRWGIAARPRAARPVPYGLPRPRGLRPRASAVPALDGPHAVP